MRYNLGYMDKYPIEAAGSAIENNPMYKITFKRPIDPIRLEYAVNKALLSYPLFKTKVKFDHEYYLLSNDNPIIIRHVKEEERPNNFGKNTNYYPWQMTYFDNKLCFEWMHGITDGAGAKTFLVDVLYSYYNFEPLKKSKNFLVAPGLEPFYDKKEKGVNFEKEPIGYKAKYIERKKTSFKCDCHSLECSTEEIVKLARICNSSVVPLIAVLYSRAIRKHLSPKAKNKNVACNVAIDVRRNLNYETMHNCSDEKRFTYIDEYDKMNIKSVAEIYKHKLDNARIPANEVRSITERVKVFKIYHFLRFKFLLKLFIRLYCLFAKDKDCNFVITYIGKIELPKEVSAQIENFELILIPDFGQCVISATDFNGRFNLKIQSSFVDKGIDDDFIRFSRKIGLHWTDLGTSEFAQSRFIEK